MTSQVASHTGAMSCLALVRELRETCMRSAIDVSVGYFVWQHRSHHDTSQSERARRASYLQSADLDFNLLCQGGEPGECRAATDGCRQRAATFQIRPLLTLVAPCDERYTITASELVPPATGTCRLTTVSRTYVAASSRDSSSSRACSPTPSAA